jgi:hypothetical protein
VRDEQDAALLERAERIALASPAPFEISTPFLRPSILPLWGPYFSNSRFMMPVPRVSDRNSP